MVTIEQNLPRFRAQSFSGRYISGQYNNIIYFKDKHYITELVNISGKGLSNNWDYYKIEIDPSTLAINFPYTKADTNGIHIYGSLAVDNMGGDIVLIDGTKYTVYTTDGNTYLEDLDEDIIGNSLDLEYGYYHRKHLYEVREPIEVIGIKGAPDGMV